MNYCVAEDWAIATDETISTHKFEKLYKDIVFKHEKNLFKCKVCGINMGILFKDCKKCYWEDVENDHKILRDYSCSEYLMEQILK